MKPDADDKEFIVIIMIVAFIIYLTMSIHISANTNINFMHNIAYSHMDTKLLSKLELKTLEIKIKFLSAEYVIDYCTDIVLATAFIFSYIVTAKFQWFASLTRKRRKQEFIFYPSTTERIIMYCLLALLTLLVVFWRLVIREVFFPLFFTSDFIKSIFPFISNFIYEIY